MNDHCDMCGTRLNRYNTTGRCHPCAHKIGWPVGPTDAMARPTPISTRHTPDCECFTRRQPLLDANGVQVKRSSSRSRVWVIPVTCPDCHHVRHARPDGLKGDPYCTVGYVSLCRRCSVVRNLAAAKAPA